MSDGHLYLGDDTAAFAGDARAVWYDEGHSSVLVMDSSLRQLREVSLQPPSLRDEAPRSLNARAGERPRASIARSKSVPVLTSEGTGAFEWNHASATPTTEVVFDFSRSSGRHTTEEPTLLVRMSLDREFLAFQRSDVEVQIVRVTTGESYWVVCDSKRGNRILPGGVLWNVHAALPQSSQDLFLITRLGIEQYRVSPKRRSCALHRTIGVYVHNFWYSAPHSVLIISTSSRANEIVPFSLQGPNVEKMPRLVFSSAVMENDLYLASLYGELYAVYCDLKAVRLLMYRVTKDKVSCVRSWHLMLPPGSPVEFSVVDNLLVCHSVEFSVSFFFDVNGDSGVHEAFSHPLPVSLTPPASLRRSKLDIQSPITVVDPTGEVDAPSYEGNDIAAKVLGSSAREPTVAAETTAHLYHHHSQDNSEPTDSTILAPWQFLPPDRVQRCVTIETSSEPRIEIRRLYLNLEQIRRTNAQHPEIISFLLRRGDQSLAKRLALAIVRDRLVDQVLSPSAASSLLASVQTTSFDTRGGNGWASDESSNDTSSDDEPQFRFAPRTVVPMSLRKRFFRTESLSSTAMPSRQSSRNGSGLTLIFQGDFHEFVWKPLLSTTSATTKAALSSYIVEFIRLLDQSQVPVESITYCALAKAYIVSDQAVELVQHLTQQQGVHDSLALADLLVRNRSHHLSLLSLALEMYTRLGAYTTVVQLLLDAGQSHQAIAVAWKHMKPGSCDASAIPGVRFFQSCIQALESSQPSPLVAQQRLHTLLLFLRIWDSECLYGEPSFLASACTGIFPDKLLSSTASVRWRKSFGFPPASSSLLEGE